VAAALAIAASMLWGTADFLGGVMSRRYKPIAVYGWAQVFGCAALALFAVSTGAWRADLGYLPWAIATGVVGLFSMVLFYTALSTGPMGIVSPLVAVSVVIPLGYGLLRGESPASTQVFGIVLAVSGILLASGPELTDPGSARPLLLAALSAVAFGAFVIFLDIGSETSPVMTVAVSRVVVVLLMVVVAVAFRSTGGIAGRDFGVVATLGIMEAASNVMFAVSITLDMLATTSVLGSLYPVATAVLAAIFLRERLKPIQYVGVAAAMIGVVLIAAGE
jgi:drug/metabolite transporter (DMT)-like permease